MKSHPNDRLRRVRAEDHPHDWFRVNRNRSPMLNEVGRTQRWWKRTRSGVLGLVAVAVIAGMQLARAAPKDKVDVFEVATGEPVTGAFSMLDRTDDGITTKLRSRSIPGHAYTLWYVIFNAPENCSDGVCGEDDIFADPTDHSAGFNEAQIVAARVSVVWGKDGAVANPAGRVTLDGGLGRSPTVAQPWGQARRRGGDPRREWPLHHPPPTASRLQDRAALASDG